MKLAENGVDIQFEIHVVSRRCWQAMLSYSPVVCSEPRMLRSIATEIAEWLVILSVLIGGVIGVTVYTTGWMVMLPVRMATTSRQRRQHFGNLPGGEIEPITLSVHPVSKAA